jgi:hypothetical protein
MRAPKLIAAGALVAALLGVGTVTIHDLDARRDISHAGCAAAQHLGQWQQSFSVHCGRS